MWRFKSILLISLESFLFYCVIRHFARKSIENVLSSFVDSNNMNDFISIRFHELVTVVAQQLPHCRADAKTL